MWSKPTFSFNISCVKNKGILFNWTVGTIHCDSTKMKQSINSKYNHSNHWLNLKEQKPDWDDPSELRISHQTHEKRHIYDNCAHDEELPNYNS